MDRESVWDEKVKVLKAIAPITNADLVREQFVGYQQEPGGSRDSRVETSVSPRRRLGSLAISASRRLVLVGHTRSTTWGSA
jgi:glucose-6-phosphate 1-dehydrogenase